MVLPHERPKIPSIKVEPILLRTRALQKAKFRMHSLRNRRMDLRPLSLLKSIRIKSSRLTLPFPTLSYEGIPYIFPDSIVKWTVEYENLARIRRPFGYEQEIDGVLEDGKEVLRAKKSMTVSVPYTITEPTSLTGTALVIFRNRFADFVQKILDIGLLRYKLKPIDEYPAPEGLNEDLTIVGGVEGLKKLLRDAEKPGKVGAFISAPGWSGFRPHGDTFFRPPNTYPSVNFRWGINNTLSTTRIVEISGPTLGVVYEDENHITWGGGRIIRVQLSPRTTRTISISQSIPPWMYGRILILNAVWTRPRPHLEPDIYYVRISEFKVGDMVPPR